MRNVCYEAQHGPHLGSETDKSADNEGFSEDQLATNLLLVLTVA